MEKLNNVILKKIFANLDSRSLGVAKSVCKKWRDIINKKRLYSKSIKTQPHHTKLNNDVLEKVFTYLNFRSLIVAEMVCKRWKEVICERRLFWQLSKAICRASKRKLPMSIKFDISNFRREKKKLKRYESSPSSRRRLE